MSDREAKEAREVEQGYKESSLREVRLREWMSGLDDPRRDKAFQRMVGSLRVIRWQKQVRAEGGERHEQLKRRQRKWEASTKAARDAKRRAAAVANVEVITCTCGARFCNVPMVVGTPRRWCSFACERRAHHREKVKGAVLSCRTCAVEVCRVPWASGRLQFCSEDCRLAARKKYMADWRRRMMGVDHKPRARSR